MLQKHCKGTAFFCPAKFFNQFLIFFYPVQLNLIRNSVSEGILCTVDEVHTKWQMVMAVRGTRRVPKGGRGG